MQFIELKMCDADNLYTIFSKRMSEFKKDVKPEEVVKLFMECDMIVIAVKIVSDKNLNKSVTLKNG